jgi:hypothetical protein
MNYIIKIIWLDGKHPEPELITLKTDDIDWSMREYQRNRPPFKWEIINKE